MRVLLIKTSSLGDIIHTFPAVNDAYQAIPGLEIDWVVEEAFAALPLWHPAVKNVIQVPIRRLKKMGWKGLKPKEWMPFIQQIRSEPYDRVVDAQGLFKSAAISLFAQGSHHGYDRHSAREGWVSLFYQHRYAVSKTQHAILRTRQLLSQALHYKIPNIHSLACGLVLPEQAISIDVHQPYLVFLHGTTWGTKHYPDQEWQALMARAVSENFVVYLPWGNEAEHARAKRFSQMHENIRVLPRTSLLEVAHIIAHAKGVVSVDTGLGHLAAAMSKPLVALYGPTDPKLTGMLGDHSQSLSSHMDCAPCLQDKCRIAPEATFPPCFNDIPSDRVWQILREKMGLALS